MRYLVLKKSVSKLNSSAACKRTDMALSNDNLEVSDNLTTAGLIVIAISFKTEIVFSI